MKKITIVIVLATLCLNFRATCQVYNIKPLKIGDTVPERFWNLKLNVVNASKGVNSIFLKDYRNKIIILDFWATWCSACISEMPRTKIIQKEFKDKLVILGCTQESGPKISKYISTNEVLSNVKPFSIVGDSVLRAYFPHKLIPHYVWLNQGKVIAITKADEISNGKIQSVILNQSQVFREKKDILNFDKNRPLLQNNSTPINTLVIYNSVLTSYFSGLFSGQGVQIDSALKRKRFYFINRPILSLYSSALTYELNNKVILNVKNIERFTRDKTVSQDWQTLNSYCYELTVPLDISDVKARQLMFEDLNRYLGLNAKIKDTLINCLAIRPSKAQSDSNTNIKVDSNTSTSQFLNNQIQGRPLKPIIFDESKGKPIPEIVNYGGDILKLQNILKQYYLDLIPVKRVVKMLIVNDLKMSKNTSNESIN